MDIGICRCDVRERKESRRISDDVFGLSNEKDRGAINQLEKTTKEAVWSESEKISFGHGKTEGGITYTS